MVTASIGDINGRFGILAIRVSRVRAPDGVPKHLRTERYQVFLFPISNTPLRDRHPDFQTFTGHESFEIFNNYVHLASSMANIKNKSLSLLNGMMLKVLNVIEQGSTRCKLYFHMLLYIVQKKQERSKAMQFVDKEHQSRFDELVQESGIRKTDVERWEEGIELYALSSCRF